MSDLISRNALLLKLKEEVPNKWDADINYFICNAPSVEAVPVVHASWRGYNAENKDFLMDNGEPIFIVCSECACTVINNGSYVWNYCPDCGAKMDGKKVE